MQVSFDEAKLLICQSLRCAADLTKAPSPTQEEVRLAFDAHATWKEETAAQIAVLDSQP